MLHVSRRAAMRALASMAVATCLTAGLPAQQPAGANPDAARIENPVPATPESIAAGKKTYDSYCAGCHAPEGKGGLILSITEDKGLPPPPAFDDAEWDHGATDGEIYVVIRDGVGPDYVMGPWKDRLPEPVLWNVVNYVKSLSVKK
ncbi:MAG: c-type cytochrome [Acidobacteria bacterium]|nr:c-type cytochrome [Acidobacteriota bacterium]